MPTNDESKILPPMMNDGQRAQASRKVLGVLLALLFVAIVLALWSWVFNDGDSNASGDQGALPTAVTIPTSTPAPESDPAAPTAVATEPTTAPLATPTPLPDGFEACADTGTPLTTTTYIVDTNTTPLNQRSEPAVGSEQAGTFDPGQTGLVFTGECVVNVGDGYTWWQIFNGTQDVWVASSFVTQN